MTQEEVIIYDSIETINIDQLLIWTEIVREFEFEKFDEGCYAEDYAHNKVTNQWALPLKDYYKPQIIKAIGLDKYNTKTYINKNDPNWFPTKEDTK